MQVKLSGQPTQQPLFGQQPPVTHEPMAAPVQTGHESAPGLPSASAIKANYLKFAGATDDAAFIKALPPAMQIIYNVARKAAEETGSETITANHLIFAMIAKLQDITTTKEKTADDRNLQAALAKALLPNLTKAGLTPGKAADALELALHDISAELEAKRGKTKTVNPGLAPDLQNMLIRLSKGDPNNMLAPLVQTIKWQGMSDPNYSLVSNALRQADDPENSRAVDMADVLMAFKKDGALAGITQQAVGKAVLQGANKEEIGLAQFALGLVSLAGEVKDNPEILKPDARLTDKQRQVKIALDALIPPEVRQNIPAEGLAKALDVAAGKLQKVQVNAEAARGQYYALCRSLYAFASDGKRTDYSTRALVDYLINEVPKQQEGPANATTVAKTLENLRRNKASERAAALKRVQADISKAAKTPDEFKKLLDEQYFQENSAMRPDQYMGIQQMITDFENAKDSGGDKDKYRRRLSLLLNDMDWVFTESNLDPQAVKAQLDADHTGLDKPKKRIVEYISVQKNLEEQGLPPYGTILGMVGPPGVGKTSLAQSLGKATGRKVVRIALGGLKREEDLRGHDSTYVGSLAGRIAKAIAKSGSMNPIVVLDEIDKVGAQELADALLELLDPEQNKNFVDKFIGDEVPLDLSRVMFVATANYAQQIPPALYDRIEMIELESYDIAEKKVIAQNHLIDELRKKVGLKAEQFSISDEAIETVVKEYTFEAGVRELKRCIQLLAERTVTEMQAGKEVPAVIDSARARELLGDQKYFPPEALQPEVGVVNGLVVYGSGAGGAVGRYVGEISIDSQGPGREGMDVQIGYPDGYPNKNLKDMSHDSLIHARDWLRANRHRLKQFGFDSSKYKGLKIELYPQTEKAGPVDGPSAGAAKATMLMSLITNRPIRSDLAMTGTISVRGKVDAIGGLKHKLRGAMDAGMRVALFPKANLKDEWRDVPDRMKQELALVDIKDLVANPEMPVPAGKKMIVAAVDDITDVLNVSLLPQVKTAEQALSEQGLSVYDPKKPSETPLPPEMYEMFARFMQQMMAGALQQGSPGLGGPGFGRLGGDDCSPNRGQRVGNGNGSGKGRAAADASDPDGDGNPPKFGSRIAKPTLSLVG